MKKFLLSITAVALTTTAFAAEIGDTTVVIDQKFDAETVLVNPSNNKYMWGDEIQGMIKPDGLYVTNWMDGATDKNFNNYTNRDFLTFKSAQGSATKELCISYQLYNVKDKGQANTEYEINYYNSNKKFVFGIQETSGGWAYGANIITANEDGTTTVTALPAGHMAKGGGELVNLSVKYSGETAIIEIDGNTYSAYSKTKGIQFIRLAVGGAYGYDRDMYIQSYKLSTVEVEAVETAKYTLKYIVGDDVIKETEKYGVVGSEIALAASDEEPIWNDDNTVKYLYVSNDAEGKTVDAEGTTVVTLNYRVADTWNYSIKNNVNDKTIDGTCIEGESATIAYSRYIISADNVVWMKGATDKQYNYTFTPDTNNFEAILDYTATEETGVLFIEAEELPGLTEVTSGNANIRCSNSAAGYNEEGAEIPVEICKLPAGTYKVEIAVWGGAGSDLIVKAGEDTVLSVTTTGSWTQGKSEEFVLDNETTLTFEGATSSRPVDYFLITDATSTAVNAINAANADGKWYNLQGVRVAEPTRPGLYIHNGKKIIVK